MKLYAKAFSSMFDGSMYGAGSDAFAVWLYLLVKSDHFGHIDINPCKLAGEIGMAPDAVERAIEYLGAPDPRSRSKECEGRRIVKEGEFLYHVVNFEKYKEMRDAESKKAYDREYRRKQRGTIVVKNTTSSDDIAKDTTVVAKSSQLEVEKELEKRNTLVNSTSESTTTLDDPEDAAMWRELIAAKVRDESERQRAQLLHAELLTLTDGDVVFTLPMWNNETFEATGPFVARLAEEYPGVDVIGQMQRIKRGMKSGRYMKRDKSLTIAFITGRCEHASMLAESVTGN